MGFSTRKLEEEQNLSRTFKFLNIFSIRSHPGFLNFYGHLKSMSEMDFTALKTWETIPIILILWIFPQFQSPPRIISFHVS